MKTKDKFWKYLKVFLVVQFIAYILDSLVRIIQLSLMTAGNDAITVTRILSYTLKISTVFPINFVFSKIFNNINSLLYPIDYVIPTGHIIFFILALAIYIVGSWFFIKNSEKKWAKSLLLICSILTVISTIRFFIFLFAIVYGWSVWFNIFGFSSILGLIISLVIIYYLLFILKIYKKE